MARFTLEDVGRALFTSDPVPKSLSKRGCVTCASYILKTSLGLRAMVDGKVEVDLGEAGVLVVTHKNHPKRKEKGHGAAATV